MVRIAVPLLLLAAFFRLQLLAVDTRFHPDEAYFASFARAAAVRGGWLLQGELDKPPLTLYVQAIAMHFVGVTVDDNGLRHLDIHTGEFVARLPAIYASLITCAAVAALAKRSGNNWTAGLALLLVALSPYAIAYSATAFTDSMMVMFWVLALLTASRGQGAWTGLWAGLAYASKQQVVFSLPLIFLMWPRPRRGSWRALLAFSGVLIMLLIWDLARTSSPPVIFIAAANNTPDGFLAPVDALLPRFVTWMHHGSTLFGAPLFTATLGLFALRSTQRRMLGFALVYVVVYTVIPFNTYDRYLLPLVPLVAILAAGGSHRSKRLFPVLLISILVFGGAGAWQAARGGAKVGGDLGRHDGIDDLAAFLNDQEFGAIVYDRWLGWELNYYLGEWTDKRRAYYPSPDAMILDEAIDVPDPKYFPAPAHIDFSEWTHALNQAGFCVRRVYEAQFVVYEIQAPAHNCPNSGLGVF